MRFKAVIVALFLVSEAHAGAVNGTFNGSYECNGTTASLSLAISDITDPVTAVFSFTNQDAAGGYTMQGSFDPTSGELMLAPAQWIHQPIGYVAVGLVAVLEGDRLFGTIDHPQCGALSLQRLAVAPGQPDDPQALAPAPEETGPGAENGGFVPPPGSPLAPFAEIAAANPSSVPGNAAYPFLGNWIIDIPGGAGIWTKNVELDFIRQIEKTTWTMDFNISASNAGVLQINQDGTYRIYWLTGRWTGTWAANADDRFPGSIHLKHPTAADDDWIVFLDDEGRIQAREYPYGGLAYNVLRPIESAALAEYLLAEKDATSLLGDWTLYTPGTSDETGYVSLGQDGSYRLTDTLLDREATGQWRREEDMLVLVGGYWGDGDAYVKFGDPGQIVVISGGSEWHGLRE